MVLGELVQSILDAPGIFADIATHDPLSAVLIGIGAVLVGVSLGAFGLLTAGVVVDLIRPDRPRETYPKGE
ncbi:hypothetical protein [Halovenus marina]|jgi:hypothetical protein|uniref:hypothetical protein n=1 Tax=Halovenus marina TaxID=3396621 RepID=UPI003F57D9AA